MCDTWNREVSPSGFPEIRVVTAKLLRLPDRSPNRQWLMAEPVLHGDYRKFNSNNNWVDNADDCQAIQAFSHWTYHRSGANPLWAECPRGIRRICLNNCSHHHF
jgi:hypothetical protein